VEEKIGLIEKHGGEFGINQCLAALKLSKGTWHYRQHRQIYEDRYLFLKKPLLKIARWHPEYGYRRATSELQDASYPVNHKVVQRLQRHWNLRLIRKAIPPKPSAFRRILQAKAGHLNLVERLEDIKVLEVLYTDFTELVYCQGQRKAYLIPLLDDASKAVLGWAVGLTDDTPVALKAWKMAVQTLKRFGRSSKGIIVHQDQGPVFTGNAWVRTLLLEDSARISYSENGARGNTEMESFFSRFKSENHSLFYGCAELEELVGMVSKRIKYYNVERRHSSLGNISPLKYLEKMNLFYRRKP
jgi:putative transposase